MSGQELEALEKRLGEFVIPHTSIRLGGAGSRFRVEEQADGYRVSITLGFPAGRSAADWTDALRAHAAALALSAMWPSPWTGRSNPTPCNRGSNP